MIGMIVIAPMIAQLIEPALSWIHGTLGIDPSVITSSLFANDMGGGPMARNVAADPMLGRFNGMVVASMMGATVSFTIPFALNTVKREQHKPLLLGLLCGVVAIPAGCFFGGVIQGIPFRALIVDMLPLAVLSVLLSVGLLLVPDFCVRLFGVIGKCIQVIITLGIAIGMIELLTGRTVMKGLGTLEEGAVICINAAVIMAGAFPLLNVVSKLLRKPIEALCNKIGVNNASAVGLLACLASSLSTFEMMGDMDDKGVMLNSAFAVSAAFVLGDHLAFTMAYDAELLPGVMAGKLIAGLLGLIIAVLLHGRLQRRKNA